MNILLRLVLPDTGARKNASLILQRVPPDLNATQNEVLKPVLPGIGVEEAT